MEERRVITQGEQAVSDDPNVVISTLLGSCVSCCLWDPVMKLGGINHMLVADLSETRAAANDMGAYGMELLINEILKRGGQRNRLTAKVFGGAQMFKGLSNIGPSNVAFTLDYLAREKMECVSHSTGGRQARHLLFWPASGKVHQRFVPEEIGAKTLIPEPVVAKPAGNAPELF